MLPLSLLRDCSTKERSSYGSLLYLGSFITWSAVVVVVVVVAVVVVVVVVVVVDVVVVVVVVVQKHIQSREP